MSLSTKVTIVNVFQKERKKYKIHAAKATNDHVEEKKVKKMKRMMKTGEKKKGEKSE